MRRKFYAVGIVLCCIFGATVHLSVHGGENECGGPRAGEARNGVCLAPAKLHSVWHDVAQEKCSHPKLKDDARKVEEAAGLSLRDRLYCKGDNSNTSLYHRDTLLVLEETEGRASAAAAFTKPSSLDSRDDYGMGYAPRYAPLYSKRKFRTRLYLTSSEDDVFVWARLSPEYTTVGAKNKKTPIHFEEDKVSKPEVPHSPLQKQRQVAGRGQLDGDKSLAEYQFEDSYREARHVTRIETHPQPQAFARDKTVWNLKQNQASKDANDMHESVLQIMRATPPSSSNTRVNLSRNDFAIRDQDKNKYEEKQNETKLANVESTKSALKLSLAESDSTALSSPLSALSLDALVAKTLRATTDLTSSPDRQVQQQALARAESASQHWLLPKSQVERHVQLSSNTDMTYTNIRSHERRDLMRRRHIHNDADASKTDIYTIKNNQVQLESYDIPAITVGEGYCTLRVPDTNYAFNFSSTEDFELYFFSHEYPHIVRINYCKPIKYRCTGPDQHVCAAELSVLYPNRHINVAIGYYPPMLSVDKKSNLVLSYEGDTCNTTHNYSLNVTLRCDLSKKSSKVGIIRQDRSCHYDASFATSYICELHRSCWLEKDGSTLVLDTLRKMEEKYILPVNWNLSIIFNVCWQLGHSDERAACGLKSAMCLVNQTDYHHTTFLNLGDFEIHTRLSHADGVIKIHYANGSVCPTDSGKRYKSSISFVCDTTAKIGFAEYMGGLEECDVMLVWRTAVACSEETLVKASRETNQSCTVSDLYTGDVYNFSGVRVLTEHRFDSFFFYNFGVCKANASHCVEGTGACRNYNNSILRESAGMVNDRMLWSPTLGPYLNYTEGAPCGNGKQRNTVMKFTFANMRNNHYLITESHCTTTITISTRTAYQERCDSPFTRTELDSIMNPSVILLVNNTLSNDTIRLSTCYSFHGRKNRIRRNYGRAEQIAVVYDETTRIMRFVDGTVCPQNKMVNLSSQLSLICDVNVIQSKPYLRNIENNCTYYFEWRSRQCCRIAECQMVDGCSVRDNFGNRWILSSLGPTHVLSRKNNVSYMISTCGKSDSVNIWSIASNLMKFGRLEKVSVDYIKNMTLKLFFGNGSSCNNGNSRARAVIYLTCDDERGIGEPEVLWEEECSIGLEWRTVCPLEYGVISSSNTRWIVVISIVAVLIFAALVYVLYRYIYRTPRTHVEPSSMLLSALETNADELEKTEQG